MKFVVHDDFRVSVCDHDDSRVLGQLLMGLRHMGIRLRVAVPDVCFDLALIALSVYEIDRLQNYRRASGLHNKGGDSPPIQLSVPVLQPDVWCSRNVEDQLSDLLFTLTDYVWKFDFRHLDSRPGWDEIPESLFSNIPDQPLRVSLFSGGLDSFAGLVAQILDNPGANHILISGSSSPRISHIQQRLGNQIQDWAMRRGRDVIPVRIRFNMRTNAHHVAVAREPRTRAFVFQALGVAAAYIAGCSTLHIYENGIGALNLPYDDTQLGSDTSRAVDPRSLVQMEQLASSLFLRVITIRNPFIFSTKSEMCSRMNHFSNDAFDVREFIRITTSCAHFPQRKSGKPQCGQCGSCALRRMSLMTAGMEQFDANNYAYDFFRDGWEALGSRSALALMNKQSEFISSLISNNNAWPVLSRAFPQLDEVIVALEQQGLSEEESKVGIIRMLNQHCLEPA